MSLGQRFLNLLIALDQLAYVVVTLGAGFPDETLSSAAWRVEQEGRIFGQVFRPVIDALFFVLTLGAQRNHCRAAYCAEKRRLQLPQTYRGSAR
ncbi:hypothetical protein ACT80S_18570 [Ramlibacter sp. MAHUQ-53]|uniref:hypothetical protein n=1 Tax=unclassified Ramlibacter TaxID=2617605 RepID=UPI00362FB6F9